MNEYDNLDDEDWFTGRIIEAVPLGRGNFHLTFEGNRPSQRRNWIGNLNDLGIKHDTLDTDNVHILNFGWHLRFLFKDKTRGHETYSANALLNAITNAQLSQMVQENQALGFYD